MLKKAVVSFVVLAFLMAMLSGIAFSQESVELPSEYSDAVLHLVDSQTGDSLAGVITLTWDGTYAVTVHPDMNGRAVRVAKMPYLIHNVQPVSGQLFGYVLVGPEDPPVFVQEPDPAIEDHFSLGVYEDMEPEAISELPGSPLILNGYIMGFEPLSFRLSIIAGFTTERKSH